MQSRRACVLVLLAVLVLSSALSCGAVLLNGPQLQFSPPQSPSAVFYYRGQLHVAVSLLDGPVLGALPSLHRYDADLSLNASLDLPITCYSLYCTVSIVSFEVPSSVSTGDDSSGEALAYLFLSADASNVKHSHWALVAVDLRRWAVVASYNASSLDYTWMPYSDRLSFLVGASSRSNGVGQMQRMQLPIAPDSLQPPLNVSQEPITVFSSAPAEHRGLLFACVSDISGNMPIGLLCMNASSLQAQGRMPSYCLNTAYSAERELLAVASREPIAPILSLYDARHPLPSLPLAALALAGNATGLGGTVLHGRYAFVSVLNTNTNISLLVQVDIEDASAPRLVDQLQVQSPFFVNMSGLMHSSVVDSIAKKLALLIATQSANGNVGVMLFDFS